jgi:hypothetical protein
MNPIPRILAFLLIGSLLSCSDGSTGPQSVHVRGIVRDYFTATPIASATVASAELPNRSTTSAGDGAFDLGNLPTDLVSTTIVTFANYRPTRNVAIAVDRSDVTADAFAVSETDANRQYTGLGLTETAGNGMIIANLVGSNGTPRTGIPLSNIELLDQNLVAVGVGPFVFGAAGDMVDNGTLSVSTAFSGRSRIGFVNVPPGTYTLSVTTGTVDLRTAVVEAGGVTLVQR